MGRLKRACAVVSVAVCLALGTSAPVDADAPPTVPTTNVSTAVLVGEPDDQVVGPKAHVFRSGPDQVGASKYGSNAIQTTVLRGNTGVGYSMFFQVPSGQTLAPGTYSHTDGSDSTGHPSVQLLSGSYGCNGATGGVFTIHDIGDNVSRLWVTWALGCNGTRNTAFGELKWNEPADSDLLVEPQQITWADRPVGNPGTAVPVTLVNTGSAPITVSGAALDATTAFGVDNKCTSIAAGDSCAMNVNFNPPAQGTWTGTLTVTDSSARGSHTVGLSGVGAAAAAPLPNPTATLPPQPPAPYPGNPWDYSQDKAVENLTAQVTNGNQVTLQWTVPDFTATHRQLKQFWVTGLAGSVAPTVESQGFQIYVGDGTSATTSALQSGGPYSFTVFADYGDAPLPAYCPPYQTPCPGRVDVHGNPIPVGPGASLTVADAEVTLSLDRSEIPTGSPTALTGHAADSQTGAPLPNGTVQIIALDRSTAATSVAASVTADAQGNFAAALKPTRSYEYSARFTGDAAHLGGSSNPVFQVVDQPPPPTVTSAPPKKVQQAAGISASKKTIKHGTTVQLRGTSSPAAGGALQLQQYKNGKWTTVAQKNADSHGTATFTQKLSKKGSYSFRIHSTGSATATGGTSRSVQVKAT